MTLMGKVVRRGPKDWLLVVEALALLAFFRVCLAVVPVRRIIRTMTHGPGGVEGERKDLFGGGRSMEDHDVARWVGWGVHAAARHSVVRFVCFPQTLTGYTLLRWRGVKSTIVYGVARSPEGDLQAHTWLMMGDRIVTGGDEAGGFTEVERWS